MLSGVAIAYHEAVPAHRGSSRSHKTEMWRAIRLVVDPGMHARHFHKYRAMDEPNVQSEVDRDISWPGQALAYKPLDVLDDEMHRWMDARLIH